MKTLFERLRPEIKNKLLSEQKDYPYLVGELLEVLNEEVAVTSLKLGDLTSLSNYAPTHISKIIDLYDMFEN